MIRSHFRGSDVRGTKSFLLYQPDELGVDGVSLAAAGGFVDARQVSVEGFEHFQICFQGTVATTIVVSLGKGEPFSAANSSSTLSAFPAVTIVPTAYNSIYWGIALHATTAGGDRYAFSRTIHLRFTNTGGALTVLTAWLECMG